MASGTKITRLNFDYQELSKTLIDKQNGIKVILGHIRGLRSVFQAYEHMNMGFCIALQDQGVGQGHLDRQCEKLNEDADMMGIDILVTRADLPFDNRWFLAGDLKMLLDAARLNKIHCPFSEILYDDILEQMRRV